MILVVLAGVGGQRKGVRVGLPDVNLGTARTERANAGLGIAAGRLPALKVADAAKELEVARALRVAVARAVAGAGLVGGLVGDAAVGGHGDKVQGRVEAAGNGGQIDIKGEFVADQVKGLVRVGVLEQIHSGPHVRAVFVLSDEAEVQGIARGGDTIGSLVVDTLSLASIGTVLVAGTGIRPRISVIAVGATRCLRTSVTFIYQ